MNCCGKERRSRFCPDCGKALADGVGAELLQHCNANASKCRKDAERYEKAMSKHPYPDVIDSRRDGAIRAAEKWERRAAWCKEMIEQSER